MRKNIAFIFTYIGPAGTFDRDGCIVILNKNIICILLRMTRKRNEVELWHQWYLESGYGPCRRLPLNRVFQSIDAVAEWVAQKVGGNVCMSIDPLLRA